ncbi:MAG: 7-cyano-7-deazaguanine synthase [Aquificaceae bacterium]|nr:7-cyano-7-deazaguanine synthase [Aquificaceae bacterium]MDW8096719.1 7-cyano-7-deazaguanine synthase [Aquificaceae bacterium]
MPKVVVLFSGGVESTCLLYLYLRKGWLVYPLYVRAGYFWESLELENARRLWRHAKRSYRNLLPLRAINLLNPEPLDRRRHEEDLYIPLRNLGLVTCAGIYASAKGIKRVAIGSLGIYPFPDNNAQYMQNLRQLLGMELLTPFMGMDKREVVRRFAGHVPLEKTLSCILPHRQGDRIVPCGRCEKCKEREEALESLVPYEGTP